MQRRQELGAIPHRSGREIDLEQISTSLRKRRHEQRAAVGSDADAVEERVGAPRERRPLDHHSRGAVVRHVEEAPRRRTARTGALEGVERASMPLQRDARDERNVVVEARPGGRELVQRGATAEIERREADARELVHGNRRSARLVVHEHVADSPRRSVEDRDTSGEGEARGPRDGQQCERRATHGSSAGAGSSDEPRGSDTDARAPPR
jgi:hypothetical protein